MSEHTRNTLSGLGWACAAILVWSGSLVLMRLGVTTSLNAYDLTMLRFGVAALILSPVALRKGVGTRRLRSPGLIAMVLAFGAPYVLLMALAMTSVPAAVAGALNPGVMAIASVLMARLILGDRIGGVRWGGLVLAAAGIGLFGSTGGGTKVGHVILVGTGVMWAGYGMIVRRAAVPALNATAIVAIGSAVVYLPIYLLALPKRIAEAPLADVMLQAGFQGVLVSVVAVYAFTRSAELLGPVAGAALPALIPVVTLGLEVAVLGETLGTAEAGAAIIVSLGVGLILVGGPTARRSRPQRVSLNMSRSPGRSGEPPEPPPRGNDSTKAL